MGKLRVRVQPKARRDKVVAFRDGLLTLRVAAPPIEGQANRAAVALLAKLLGVAQITIEILKGRTSRQKLVSIAGLSDDEIKQRLESA